MTGLVAKKMYPHFSYLTLLTSLSHAQTLDNMKDNMNRL